MNVVAGFETEAAIEARPGNARPPTGSFDLVDEPWIPVWRLGRIEYCSLRSALLGAAEIDWLASEYVLQTAGVLRLLEALTYRITGLDSERVAPLWHSRRNQILTAGAFDSEAVDAYFDAWQHRFDLFHPDRPFGQDPRLRDEQVKVSQIGKVVFGVPAGNSPAWFAQADAVLGPADAAQWLLAALCFASGGRTSTRQADATSLAAPSRNRVCVHLRGESLLTSLLANLVCPISESEPLPWEGDLPAPDKSATLTSRADAANITLGRWRHAFLFERDNDGAVAQVRSTWLHRQVLEVDDPHLIYYHRPGTKGAYERLARSVDPSYPLWRDVLALREDPLLTEHGDESGVAVVNAAAGLDDDVLDTIGVVAIAHQADKSTDLLSWEATMPRGVLDWLLNDQTARDRAEQILERVGALHAALRSAFNYLRKEVGKQVARDFDELRDGALSRFLAEAERRFWAAIDDPAVPPRLALLALSTFDESVTSLAEVPQYSYKIQGARKRIVTAGWPSDGPGAKAGVEKQTQGKGAI